MSLTEQLPEAFKNNEEENQEEYLQVNQQINNQVNQQIDQQVNNNNIETPNNMETSNSKISCLLWCAITLLGLEAFFIGLYLSLIFV